MGRENRDEFVRILARRGTAVCTRLDSRSDVTASLHHPSECLGLLGENLIIKKKINCHFARYTEAKPSNH